MGHRLGPWIEYIDYTDPYGDNEDKKVRLVHHSTADIFEFQFGENQESEWFSPERFAAMNKALEEFNK